MRVPICEALGSLDNIDLLSAIREAPADFYDSQIVKIIDYMWQSHGWKVIMFNIIYLMYPIMLSLIVVLPKEDIYTHKSSGITVSVILFFIEI